MYHIYRYDTCSGILYTHQCLLPIKINADTNNNDEQREACQECDQECSSSTSIYSKLNKNEDTENLKNDHCCLCNSYDCIACTCLFCSVYSSTGESNDYITEEEKLEYQANKTVYLTRRMNRRKLLLKKFQEFKLNSNFKLKPRYVAQKKKLGSNHLWQSFL